MNMNDTNIYGCSPVETRRGASLRRCYAVVAIFLTLPFLLYAQDQVSLQFTGQDQSGQYVRLNTVFVENLTKRWQEVLYYPDSRTLLSA